MKSPVGFPGLKICLSYLSRERPNRRLVQQVKIYKRSSGLFGKKQMNTLLLIRNGLQLFSARSDLNNSKGSFRRMEHDPMNSHDVKFRALSCQEKICPI